MSSQGPSRKKRYFFSAGVSATESDVESLLTLHGVLCAFLVSISLGIELGVTPSALTRADFYGGLARHQDFREWVVYVIDRKNNETPGGFEWNVTVAPGLTVDFKHELLHGIGNRWPKEQWFTNAYYGDVLISHATSVLYPEMDTRFMETFFLDKGPNERDSTRGEQWAAASSALLFSGLIANVILYLSWVLSPSAEGEDVTGRALTQWKAVGMPMIYLNYVLLLLAITFMFCGNVFMMLISHPYLAEADGIYGAGFYLVIIAVSTCAFVVGGGAAFWCSKRGKKQKLKQAAPADSGDDDAVKLLKKLLALVERADVLHE